MKKKKIKIGGITKKRRTEKLTQIRHPLYIFVSETLSLSLGPPPPTPPPPQLPPTRFIESLSLVSLILLSIPSASQRISLSLSPPPPSQTSQFSFESLTDSVYFPFPLSLPATHLRNAVCMSVSFNMILQLVMD